MSYPSYQLFQHDNGTCQQGVRNWDLGAVYQPNRTAPVCQARLPQKGKGEGTWVQDWYLRRVTKVDWIAWVPHSCVRHVSLQWQVWMGTRAAYIDCSHESFHSEFRQCPKERNQFLYKIYISYSSVESDAVCVSIWAPLAPNWPTRKKQPMLSRGPGQDTIARSTVRTRSMPYVCSEYTVYAETRFSCLIVYNFICESKCMHFHKYLTNTKQIRMRIT